MTVSPDVPPDEAAELLRLRVASGSGKTVEARSAAYDFAVLAARLHEEGHSWAKLGAAAGVTSGAVRRRLQTLAFLPPYPSYVTERPNVVDRWNYRERLIAGDDAQRSTP